ncbi:MAG: FKBP-type peptidyl-prolyl cis-trans isomerase [Armatimonadetes bacterium]|nr:FKBP-type peptidyl-prolyl cis-trans isomerase [Armatimonadota bacterium]
MKGTSYLFLPILASLLLAGCSSDSAKTEATSPTDKPTESKDAPKTGGSLAELKIEDIEPGKGYGANDGDLVTVLYRGTLADGTEFDGNMDASLKPKADRDPFAVPLGAGRVIPGWDQGLKGIKVGGVRKLSIPSKLGYGEQSQDKIPANSDLFFTVKCLNIVKKGEEMVIDTKDTKQGTGAAVKNGDKVTIHYVGTLLNGKKFDSSRDRNQPFEFKVGNGDVVPGFDKGVLGMKKGGIRTVVIPPDAAYGARPTGSIPPNSVLQFEIELLKVNGK